MPTRLRHAALDLVLDGAELRTVRWGSTELIRRLGVAVRDTTWRTVPAVLEHRALVTRRDGFTSESTCRHTSGELDVRWTGRLEGRADGSLAFGMRWTALRAFAFNRIGLVVLLDPRTVAGRRWHCAGPDGHDVLTASTAIAPQPFRDGRFHAFTPPFQSLTVETADGVLACAFSGELFEAEDQRNWTDASFKVYGTPLARPLPLHAEAGETFEQTVTVSFAARTTRPRRPHADAELEVGAPAGERVGALGLVYARAAASPSDRELETLRALGPAYLRHDVGPDLAGEEDALQRTVDVCAALGCRLELAVPAEAPAEVLAPLVARAAAAGLDRVLIFGTRPDPASPASCTPPEAVGRIAALSPGSASIVAGTDLRFAELNRWRPDLGGAGGVGFSIDPQVHAEDRQTLVENLQAVAETVAGARALTGLPVSIGRLVLREGSPDPRHGSPFAAVWTLGALAGCLGAGARSVTAFRSHGPGGVVARDGTPLPPAGPMREVCAQPLAAVHAVDGAPDDVVALALRSDSGAAVLVGSLREEEVTVRLRWDGASAALRLAPDSWAKVVLHPVTPPARAPGP